MIDLADPEVRELIAELRKVVQRLALISHAEIQGYNFAPSEVGRGDRWRRSNRKPPIPHLGQHQGKSGDTKAPGGDVDHYGDFQVGFRQKSHLYFDRQLARLLKREKATKDDLAALVFEAEQTLEDWRKTPVYQGPEPIERGSFRWKCLIADYGGASLADGDVQRINDLYALGKTIHRSTIYRYRAQFRGLRRSVRP